MSVRHRKNYGLILSCKRAEEDCQEVVALHTYLTGVICGGTDSTKMAQGKGGGGRGEAETLMREGIASSSTLSLLPTLSLKIPNCLFGVVGG